MSPEIWRDRVRGMVEDIDRILAFIEGHDRSSFADDEKTVFAVSYGFVRIGEAASKLPQEVIDANPSVPWREIRQFRNFMVHVYEHVDPARLFDTAKTELPSLRESLTALAGA